MLRIAADLQHALAELGECRRQVGRRRALADAALAVDGEDLGGAGDRSRVALCTWTLPSPSRDGRAALLLVTLKSMSLSCGNLHSNAFEAIFEIGAGLLARRRELMDPASSNLRSCASSSRLATFADAVGLSAARRSRISASSTNV